MKYFDYTATTPVDEEVLECYIKTTHNFFANTSSLNSLGERSNYMYELSSNELKNILDLQTHNIIYTSNATEANNIAIQGVVNNHSTGKIITSKIEHPSVYEVMKSLEGKYEVVYLDIDKNGLIDIEQLKRELNNNTILVSIMWVNNIIGTIQPIKDVINLVKKYPKTKLHVDMVQGICKVMPDFKLSDIDLLTFSTHKIYGPKGIGGLFFRKNLSLKSIMYGSKVQYGLKPGTFDLSLIASTVKAFKKFYPTTLDRANDVHEKFDYLYSSINNDKIVINTPKNNISYYILNISIPSMNGETVVHKLEQKDIYVSTGSACSSKQKKPEKTILALTNNFELALSSIRISLSNLTSFEEIDVLIKALNEM